MIQCCVLLIVQLALALASPAPVVRRVSLADDGFTQRVLRSRARSPLKFDLGARYRDRVFLYLGDITRIPTDAIANAVNEYCLGGSGVDGAVHKAVGVCPATGKGVLRAEVVAKLAPVSSTWKRCPVGSARPLQVPWHLPAKGRTLNPAIKYILQASGPRGKQAHLLKQTYGSVLTTAHNLGVRHVAIPAISTGSFGFPRRDAARIAVRTVKQFLDESHSNLQVVFVVRDRSEVPYYAAAMKEYLHW